MSSVTAPITVEEKFESPEGWTRCPGKSGGTLIFVVRNDGSEPLEREDALDALSSETEAEIITGTETVYRRSYTADPVNLYTWIGRVSYAPDNIQSQGNNYEFDTSGGTQHITNSLSTNRYGGAPDNANLINVKKGDATPDGVDRIVPIFSFSETHYKSPADVDENYKIALMNLTGKTNNAAFKGHQIGEVLFLGASGSRRSGSDWEINYKFAVSPNRNNITVAGISGVSAKGWDYIWTLTDTVVDGLPTVAGVYVEQIYESGDFDDLEI